MQTSSPPRSLSPLARRIGEGWPEDGYDDLLLPIIAALAEDPDADELAADLRTVLETDYGLPSPEGCHDAARTLLDLNGSGRRP